ncbi:hypothetical protein SBA4_2530013 [Candidatus Sulfopaludibacter sp. SbA4]|nr:hypothetical protein SBA4_2530013 [Candidatus Sulfopaludibacter sp. SbA4]
MRAASDRVIYARKSARAHYRAFAEVALAFAAARSRASATISLWTSAGRSRSPWGWRPC